MNKVIIIGNLTKDPEYTTTTNGVSVVRFTVAVKRKYTDKEDNDTDFIPVVAWRKLADTISKFVKKGNKVGVTGVLQSRNYEAQDGSKRSVIEIIADEVDFLTPKAEEDAQINAKTTETNITPITDIDDDDLPF